MKIISLLISVLMVPWLAGAELGLPPVDLRPGQFVEGNLFSVKYVPGDKEVSFYVVGKKKAGIQFFPKQTTLEMNGQKIQLTRNKSGDAFIYPDSVKSEAVLKLEKNDGKTEEFRLKNP